MKKLVLAVPLAAVLAVSMIVAPAFALFHEGTHLDIVAAEVQQQDGDVKLELYTADDAAAGAPDTSYGYAALTSDFQDMLAVTTHIPVGDDSSGVEDENGFHTHVVSLNGESTVCASGIEVASASADPVGILKVEGTEVKVTDVSSEDLGDLNGLVASFTLTVEADDDGNNHLCVNVADAEPASD